LAFRHEPAAARGQGGNDGECDGEIAGHLHPAARIHQRGRVLTRKCFATDGTRLVMPAFGAYTGGLNIRNIAFLKVFRAWASPPTSSASGGSTFAAARCLAD
jgi:metallophosphoesterase superfamily enzyme